MSAAGSLTISARFAGGRLADLRVTLCRPPVARLFQQQIPEAVVKTVPYLFTLCAHAQRAAAQAALAAAEGSERRAVDDGELWIEYLHENLWRLLLDWPAALGQPDARDAFVAWRGERNSRAVIERTQEALQAVRTSACACLPQLGTEEAPTATRLDPQIWLDYWRGDADRRPPPQCPVSVAAAYCRRLAETEQAARALAAGAPCPVAAAGGQGWGVGQALTARGVLTHAVHVEEGRIINYQVWAPTDALFADAGALAQLLGEGHYASAEAARQALNLAVLALDPCLPYTLELKNA
ncbi:MAG: nickel-dependent hydrogenase large subunit [Desulfobulbus sp.]|nr:nickel-dependent hydrogenase large subunit [Desulfobulbus sp.]